MKEVKVISAKTMAKKHNAVGCVVVTFDQYGKMNGASYGTNKYNCDQVGAFMGSLFTYYGNTLFPFLKFKEGRRSKFIDE